MVAIRGGWFVPVTVSAIAKVSLLGTGSAVEEPTVAIFVHTPAAIARRFRFSVAKAPEATGPNAHASMLPLVAKVPRLEEAETSSNPAGTVLLRSISMAAAGPALVTFRVRA